ncbi:origin recognition complex subunit 4 [Orobanche minor]
MFSKMEYGLAHKTIVFVLDEFDLFAQVIYISKARVWGFNTTPAYVMCSLQGKQRLLYSLLDALQSVTSQAVVVGVICRLLRSRFSHRKLLFLPPSGNDLQRLVEHILLLPTDSGIPNDYTAAFNAKILVSFREIIINTSGIFAGMSFLC